MIKPLKKQYEEGIERYFYYLELMESGQITESYGKKKLKQIASENKILDYQSNKNK